MTVSVSSWRFELHRGVCVVAVVRCCNTLRPTSLSSPGLGTACPSTGPRLQRLLLSHRRHAHVAHDACNNAQLLHARHEALGSLRMHVNGDAKCERQRRLVRVYNPQTRATTPAAVRTQNNMRKPIVKPAHHRSKPPTNASARWQPEGTDRQQHPPPGSTSNVPSRKPHTKSPHPPAAGRR